MEQSPRGSCLGTLPLAARTRVKRGRVRCHEAARPGAVVSAGTERDLLVASLIEHPLGASRLSRARTVCGSLLGRRILNRQDRKSTRLNSSHANIFTLSLHDALPILLCH